MDFKFVFSDSWPEGIFCGENQTILSIHQRGPPKSIVCPLKTGDSMQGRGDYSKRNYGCPWHQELKKEQGVVRDSLTKKIPQSLIFNSDNSKSGLISCPLLNWNII
ncbi:unnamed protein product [Blepharisma stoltei]|uniref:Uncharacterized protein n=1 Tax=Blepharisma stoltei TaxID=1481888 RepID=A0AAU9ISP3_9CILI|nr:unnamed protein product [Blepharisma stoltei]